MAVNNNNRAALLHTEAIACVVCGDHKCQKQFFYDESVNKNGSPWLQECNKAGLHNRDGVLLMEPNVSAKSLSRAQRSARGVWEL